MTNVVGLKDIGAFVAYQDETPVGCAVAYTYHDFALNEIFAHQLFWYIVPHARGRHVFSALEETLRQWAKEQGATLFVFVCPIFENPQDLAKLARFYSAYGYEPQFLYMTRRI